MHILRASFLIPIFYSSPIKCYFNSIISSRTYNLVYEGLYSTTADKGEEIYRPRDIMFSSPLLDEGYPPVVEEYEKGYLKKKPLLVYLPGFDGTSIAPFLQMPELSTTFDVRCLTMSMSDRSLYDELKKAVIDFIFQEVSKNDDSGEDFFPLSASKSPLAKGNFITKILRKKSPPRSIYIVGESFGGILASDVALDILGDNELGQHLKGLTLINAATCYDRSKLSSVGPEVANCPPYLYILKLLGMSTLFKDEYSASQLGLIFQSKALPSIIDTPQRESFMGRVAISLLQKLIQGKLFMPQETLKWRLEEWLLTGSEKMESRIEKFQQYNSLPTLIIAGGKDLCLPSIDEAERLCSIFPNSKPIVVKDTGHANTCGSRIDLAAEMRKYFSGELKGSGRTAMKAVAVQGKGVYLGMEPRYDGQVKFGLSPLKYWSSGNYREVNITKVVSRNGGFNK